MFKDKDMEAKFGQRFDRVFSTYEEIRIDTLEKRIDRDKLARALSRSCLFLRDLLSEDVIDSFQGKLPEDTTLNRFMESPRFKEFLSVERDLLKKFGVRDGIINQLEAQILNYSASESYTPDQSRTLVKKLRQHVCDPDVPIDARLDWTGFFKRFCYVAGGGFVMYLNAHPGSAMSPEFRGFSVSIGVSVMGKGAAGAGEALKALLGLDSETKPKNDPPSSGFRPH